MKNWKTTLSGFLAGAPMLISMIPGLPTWGAQLLSGLTGLGLFLLGYHAADAKQVPVTAAAIATVVADRAIAAEKKA